MNHIYRLVWCKSRNALVAASELSSRSHGGVSVSPGRMKAAKLISLAMLGAGSLIYATGAFAQSTTGSAQLDDLQSLVSKYQAPVVGSSVASGVADVAGAPVTVVRQVASSTLSTVQPAQVGVHASATPTHVQAGAYVSTRLAQAGAGVQINKHGAGVGAGVNLYPATVGKAVSGVTQAAAVVPVVGKPLSGVGNAAAAVASAVPAVHAGLGASVSIEPLVADRPRDAVVSSLAHALGIADGTGGGLPPVQAVPGDVMGDVSKVPVVGAAVAQVSSVLGHTPAGSHDLGTALGTVVGGVVNNAATLPVVGSTVASVGQNLKGATSGGSAGGGVVGGQLGEVVGEAVNSLSGTPGVGKVVSAVGTTLQETTAQIGTSGNGNGGVASLTGVVGQVVDGVAGATSNVPVVGPVVAQVGDALDSVATGTGSAGNGNALGTVGQVIDGAADATSNVPVVGSAVGQLGSTLDGVTSSQGGGLLSSVISSITSTATPAPAGVPTVPPPSDTPSGVIVGNGGVVGSVPTLLGSTTNALFDNNSTNGYITDGSLKVSNANFTQGYSAVNVLGIPVVNSTPVGTVLTTVGGAVLGGTGQNSNLTLIGGVTSNSYITNINNGATNSGLLGLVLPGSAPAWASTCANVLGAVTASCWAVNAAQNNQVLMGDGASANGSEEVVIGTNASHTLPSVTACSVFTGSGTSTDPCGVPDADYAAREGHSVVIGDSASGTANAQTILGANATSSVANSVALGYASVADRGAQSNYTAYGLSALQNSAGEVSIGSPGQERQITNVAAGSAATDAVNVAQLEGVATTADNAVQYDSTSKTSVTLAGPTSTDGGVTGGTTLTNLHQGALGATSTDAVNGSQLFATNQSLATYMGGTTNYNPTTNTWTAPTFNITSVATDGSTTLGSYNNVTDAFGAVNGSLNNINTRINSISNSAGIKYFQVNSTAADSQATGANSMATGPNAIATGDNSLAVGASSMAGGANSMAVGYGATASSDNALAVGENATAKDGNAVAVGYGNTASGNGAVALGDPDTATGQGAVAVGYDSTANGQSAVAVGSTATANGASAIAVGDTANATADNTIALGANATANLANSIALGAGSATTVGALTNYQAYGLTAPQTSSGEVNVGNRQITGVAAGSAADDAVNLAQLEAVSSQGAATSALAVKYDPDSSGNPTNTVTLTGDGSGAQVLITNLAAGAETATSTDAVNGSQLWHWTQDTSNIYSNYSLYNDIQNAQASGGSLKYFNVNSTLANSSASGSNSIAIGPQATSSGTNSVAMGNGASAMADNSVAIGAGSVADRANTVSVGSAGNERQITNVAAGTQATDAVNLGQMDSAISGSTQGTVRYDTNSDGSTDYNSVTLGDGAGDTTIHNVAAGTAATDAANVGQVQQAMDWSKSYTDQRFSQAESDIQNVNNRANAGVAAAMASAGLPQAYEPGKSMAAIAGGSFRGESSIAIGVSTISEGGRWVYKLTGSADSRGDAGVSIGAGMQW
jgi:autotransporter adhesin